MRVLMIGSDPSIFIAESAARTRLRAYAAAIGELHVLSRARVGAESVQEGALFLHPVYSSRLGALRLLTRKARELIRNHAIEIVSAQDPFEHGLIALRAIRGTTAKLHIQIHTDFRSRWFTHGGNIRSAQVHMPLINVVRQIIADYVLPRANGVRVVSERIQDSLIKRYGNRVPSISVIPIAVNTILPEAVPLPSHSFTFTLLFVGRLEPEKRIQDLIFALARIAMTYPMAGLMIVGEGREGRKLEELVEKLRISEKVMFLGNRPDARGLMQSAQAYIQASAYEGYGLTLVEAALARLPIITTDVGIVGEVFKGYDDVLVAPVADPAALATHIGGLIQDAQARSTLALNAEAAARAHLARNQDQPGRIAEDLQACLG